MVPGKRSRPVTLILIVLMALAVNGCASLKATFNPTLSVDEFALRPSHRPQPRKVTQVTQVQKTRAATQRATRVAERDDSLDGLNFGVEDHADRALMRMGSQGRRVTTSY